MFNRNVFFEDHLYVVNPLSLGVDSLSYSYEEKYFSHVVNFGCTVSPLLCPTSCSKLWYACCSYLLRDSSKCLMQPCFLPRIFRTSNWVLWHHKFRNFLISFEYLRFRSDCEAGSPSSPPWAFRHFGSRLDWQRRSLVA